MPGDKVTLRAELGISDAKRVVFFGAQKLNQRRKGMHLLVQALLRLADDWPSDKPLPLLLSAGNANDFSDLRDKGFPLVDLGYVDVPTLAKAYAAADVFACPSIEDSGPMMINESIMSGTPVVAFKMGVAEDLIQNGVTGFIAELGDIVGFSDGLKNVLFWEKQHSLSVGKHCRNAGIAKCCLGRQSYRFAEISANLLGVSPPKPPSL